MGLSDAKSIQNSVTPRRIVKQPYISDFCIFVRNPWSVLCTLDQRGDVLEHVSDESDDTTSYERRPRTSGHRCWIPAPNLDRPHDKSCTSVRPVAGPLWSHRSPAGLPGATRNPALSRSVARYRTSRSKSLQAARWSSCSRIAVVTPSRPSNQHKRLRLSATDAAPPARVRAPPAAGGFSHRRPRPARRVQGRYRCGHWWPEFQLGADAWPRR